MDPAAQPPATSSKILVVDDEMPMLQMISGALQSAGLTVIQAKNGQEGQEVALKERPDLIVTDNLMPLTTGIQMVANLRKDPWGAKVPVIVMTNVNDLNAVNESLQAGITDYVMKADVDLDQITRMVKTKLGLNG